MQKLLIKLIIVQTLCFGALFSASCKSGEVNPDPPVDTTHLQFKTDVSYWLTTPDKIALLQKQNVSLLFKTEVNPDDYC